MLGITNSLILPCLKFIKDVKFRSWSSNKTTALFYLDWDSFDVILDKKHKKWVNEYWKDELPEERPPILPEELEKYIKELKFAIPSNYIREIQYFSRLAINERNRGISIGETVVREWAHEIIETAIKIAVKMICDCRYDEKTNYFDKDPRSYHVWHLLVYKIWGIQTGRGLLRKISGLEHSEYFYKEYQDDGDTPFNVGRNIVLSWIDMIKEHEGKNEEYYNPVAVKCSCGPKDGCDLCVTTDKK